MPVWIIWLGVQLKNLSARGMYVAETAKPGGSDGTEMAAPQGQVKQDLSRDANVV